MSRTDHKLRCVAWWGDWARLFRGDNREMLRFWRRRRDKSADGDARRQIEDATDDGSP